MKSSASSSHVNYLGGLLEISREPGSVLSSLLHKRTLRLQLTESRPTGLYHLDFVTVSSGAFPESAFLTQPSTPLDHTLNIHMIIGQALYRYQQWLPEVKCLEPTLSLSRALPAQPRKPGTNVLVPCGSTFTLLSGPGASTAAGQALSHLYKCVGDKF